MLWVTFAENSPNSRAASPNFSTCSSTASTVIPNNYKRLMPQGCDNDICSSDYIEASSVVHIVMSDGIGGAGDDDQAVAATATATSFPSCNSPGSSGGGGAVTLVQAAVLIGPKDENINYGTKAIIVINYIQQQQLPKITQQQQLHLCTSFKFGLIMFISYTHFLSGTKSHLKFCHNLILVSFFWIGNCFQCNLWCCYRFYLFAKITLYSLILQLVG